MQKKNNKQKKSVPAWHRKIRDAEYLTWLCETLKEGWLTPSMIHSLALEHYQDQVDPTGLEGVKPEGIGGAIRRLLQQHCSSCKWFKGDGDLFLHEGGLWTLKPASAAVEAQATAA